MRLFERKEFLNQKGFGTDASIMAILHEHRYEVAIRDCNRFIEITAHTDKPDELQNGLMKLDVLIDVLTDLKKAIQDEVRK
jgi:hypothetical protein